ncbi:MAG: O-antigen ligase family protein [Mangrovibacterium sp.]
MHFIWIFPFILVLCTVFVINSELEDGIVSGKYFWFYFSILMAAVASVWIVLRYPESVQVGLSDFLILIFGATTIPISIWLNSSEAITKHILLLLIILLYFLFKILFRNHRSNLYWTILFLLITSFIESYWGLRQLYGFDHSHHALFKLTGSFSNPGPYACYISVVLPCAFYYLLRNWNCTKIKFKIRYWPVYLRWGASLLAFTGSLLVLPASMSRTSWLAAFGGCGLIIYFNVFKKKQANTYFQIRKNQCLFLLAFLLLIGCIWMYYLKRDSADGRILMWKIALKTAVHNPMGVGIGNFPGSYGMEQAKYFESGKGTEKEQYVAGNPAYSFNEYLQIVIEQGIVSFILFLSIIAYSFYIGIRRRLFPATASLVALLIVAMMSYPFSVLPFLIVLIFLLAWIHSAESSKKVLRPVSSALVFCSLLFVSYCFYNRYPTYQAYKQWNKYALLYQSYMYDDATERYSRIYPLLSDQLTFLFEYAQSLSKTGKYEESNQVLEKAVRISCDPMLYNVMGKNKQALKKYMEAEQCFKRAAYIVPNRIYPYYLLANLYLETGEIEKAQKMARIVLTKEPKTYSTAIKEMREKMKKIITYSLDH